MSDDFVEAVAGVGSLADPTRRALYLYVVAQPGPVGREAAAEALGVAVHTAKFHLDRLVADGVLEAEFRRLSGRTGPGAGRPAKLYRRAGRQLTVSLPERHYELVGHVLAAGLERAAAGSEPLDAAVREAAESEGRRIADEAPTSGGSELDELDELDRVASVLSDRGYEPRRSPDHLALANCPFDELARQHTALVCGINQSLVHGVLDGLGCTHVESCLDPEPGLCCVKVRATSPSEA